MYIGTRLWEFLGFNRFCRCMRKCLCVRLRFLHYRICICTYMHLCMHVGLLLFFLKFILVKRLCACMGKCLCICLCLLIYLGIVFLTPQCVNWWCTFMRTCLCVRECVLCMHIYMYRYMHMCIY